MLVQCYNELIYFFPKEMHRNFDHKSHPSNHDSDWWMICKWPISLHVLKLLVGILSIYASEILWVFWVLFDIYTGYNDCGKLFSSICCKWTLSLSLKTAENLTEKKWVDYLQTASLICCQIFGYYSCIQNPVKYLWWSFLQK